MQLFVFALFCWSPSIFCDDLQPGFYDVLHNQGVSRHVIDSFKKYLHKIAEQRKESEIQRNTYDIPVEVIKDVEDNLINKRRYDDDDDDGIDMTRRSDTKRFFSWFRNIFKAKQNGNKSENNEAFIDYLNGNREQQMKITKILSNLTESFGKLNKYLEEHGKGEFVLMKVPQATFLNATRVKRSITENITRIRGSVKKTATTTVATPVTVEATKKVEPVNVSNNSETQNITDKVIPLKVTKNLDPGNVTNKNFYQENATKTNDYVNLTEDTPVQEKTAEVYPFNNPRRTFDNSAAFNDSMEVKKKLMTYIEEYFQEVQDQIKQLQEMKQVHATDSSFRVGYIVANVDILQDNINKLRQETAANHSTWTERQLIEVFDKLKASNKVMFGLMQTVRNIYNSEKKGSPRKISTLGNSVFANFARKDST